MPTSVILAPNPHFQGRDRNGNAIANGVLYTYKTGTTIPKATFQEPSATLFNTNPVQLNGMGEANIYWETDEYYRIELYTQGGKDTGELVYTQDNYPYVTGEGSDVNTYNSIENYIRNPQFYFWDISEVFKEYLGASTYTDYIADDWLYMKPLNIGTNNNITISRQSFILGQSEVPQNPLYYFQYVCSTLGTVQDTYSRLLQRIGGVQVLAGQTVSFSFYARSTDSNYAIYPSIIQDFGTGGTPSADIETIFNPALNLSQSWQLYTGTFVVPNINGKIKGSDNNDALLFCINLPLNLICTVQIANVEFVEGNIVPPAAFRAPLDQYLRLQSRVYECLPKTGEVKFSFSEDPYPGWLRFDDGTIGSPKSNATHAGFYVKALYKLLWLRDAFFYPVFNPDGTNGIKTFNVEDDFNNGLTISLPRAMGRVFATTTIVTNAGSARTHSGGTAIAGTYNNGALGSGATITPTAPLTVLNGVTLNAGDRVLIIDQTDPVQNGLYIYNSSVLLTRASNYSTGSTIRIGTFITTPEGTYKPNSIWQMVTQGYITVGTTPINFDIYENRAPGYIAGEELHKLTIDEMPAHTHPYHDVAGNTGEAIAGGSGYVLADIPTGSTGGDLPHSILQPTIYVYTLIKL